MNKAAPIVVGIATLGAIIAIMSTRAKAAPLVPSEVPFTPMELVTREDILAATNFQQLDDYYNEINWLYRGYHISLNEYMDLYNSYAQRFYELWEAIE